MNQLENWIFYLSNQKQCNFIAVDNSLNIFCSCTTSWLWGPFLQQICLLNLTGFSSCWIFYESILFPITSPFNMLQGSQSSTSNPASSSSSSVAQEVVAAAGTAAGGSEQERKLKQYLEDERIALFLQNEEFMKELQRNREFLIALERGRKTLAHTLNQTVSTFWHIPLPLLSQFHLHKSWRVNSYVNFLNLAVNVDIDCFLTQRDIAMLCHTPFTH